MTKKIQILVIEDNRLLRDGLAALLDSQTEFKVVASAEGASSALQRLQEHRVNVVLVDAALGRNRSQRLVESIKEAAPHSRIIMMDVQPEEEDVIGEQQITDLIAEGLSNKEIAQRLNIATYTVKSHVHNILEKLALHSRLQIAAHAHKKTPPKGDRRKFVR